MVSLKVALLFTTVICWLALVQADCGCHSEASRPRLCPNAPHDVIRKCPRNEVFSCCGACEQLSCDKRKSTINCFRCPSGCYCREGYIRQNLPNGVLGRCIPIEDCPVVAVAPEVLS